MPVYLEFAWHPKTRQSGWGDLFLKQILMPYILFKKD